MLFYKKRVRFGAVAFSNHIRPHRTKCDEGGENFAFLRYNNKIVRKLFAKNYEYGVLPPTQMGYLLSIFLLLQIHSASHGSQSGAGDHIIAIYSLRTFVAWRPVLCWPIRREGTRPCGSRRENEDIKAVHLLPLC